MLSKGVPIITIGNNCAKMLCENCDIVASKVVDHGLLDMLKTNEPKELKQKKIILWNSRPVPMKEPDVFFEPLANIQRLIS